SRRQPPTSSARLERASVTWTPPSLYPHPLFRNSQPLTLISQDFLRGPPVPLSGRALGHVADRLPLPHRRLARLRRVQVRPARRDLFVTEVGEHGGRGDGAAHRLSLANVLHGAALLRRPERHRGRGRSARRVRSFRQRVVVGW